MVIYIGADHRGYNLKESLKKFIAAQGYQTADMGNSAYDPNDDYVDFAARVAEKISLDPEQRGILICGSGAGMDISANKFQRVRATVSFTPDHAFDARHDDNVNVLVLAANYTGELEAEKIVDIFLKTPYGAEERYDRRLEKISQLERG